MVVDNLSSMNQSPEEDDKEEITVAVECRWNKSHPHVRMTVKLEDWLEWKGGSPKLIQHIFPYLNSDQREMLITGTCPVCWAAMFPKDADDDLDKFIEEYPDEAAMLHDGEDE